MALANAMTPRTLSRKRQTPRPSVYFRGAGCCRGDVMKRLLLCLLVVALAVGALEGVGDKKEEGAKAQETEPKPWTRVKIPGQQTARETGKVNSRVNSPPLTMKQLRGKVVVVHFMAFG